jgi:heptosyltransferase III
VTLPALKALRDAHPAAEIQILGYPHIAAIADKRFYAEAVRSIEYGALSRFFAREAELPSDLRNYFAGFDLILSYLYDPDRIFEENLRRCGAENILRGPSKIAPGVSAAVQLARPVQDLGIIITDLAPRLFPSADDWEFARGFLENCEAPILAVHPGSGSEKKNWPIKNWIELIRAVLDLPAPSRNACFQPAGRKQRRDEGRSLFFRSIIIVSGEADETAMHQLRPLFENNSRVRFARALPLPQLAAILSHTTFIGHDSGISHLAAGSGARCIVLFGPTDPNVWAPRNKAVTVLRAPEGELAQLAVQVVLDAVMQAHV